jgi:hypothetical protein
VKFKSITPLASTVISAITFPSALPNSGNSNLPLTYIGDREIIGKTLAAGITYNIQADAVTFSSGHALVGLR